LTSKLVIGTVQFGIPYGISNTHGKTQVDEAEKILAYAYEHGIRMMDTAVSYGDAEKTIGDIICHGTVGSNWKIVTKTPHFKTESIGQQQVDELEYRFNTSRETLQSERLYGLMIHACEDIFLPGGEKLFASMQRLKEQGLVEKIGVSLYSSDQIDRLLNNYSVDLVQLPINIFDQRLLENGRLSMLKERGIEIHARSVFLQGLLLMDPDCVSPWFAPIHKTLNKFHRYAKEKSISSLQLALGFVQGIPEVDYVLVGVNTETQLHEIIAASKLSVNHKDYQDLSINDPNFVNPSNWKI